MAKKKKYDFVFCTCGSETCIIEYIKPTYEMHSQLDPLKLKPKPFTSGDSEDDIDRIPYWRGSECENEWRNVEDVHAALKRKRRRA